MSLKITTVNLKGDEKQEEFVRLVADADVNLSNYIIVDSTFSEGEISNIHRHFYRFPNLTVKKDDVVKVYTGTRKYSTTTKSVGDKKITVHHLYNGSDAQVWNDDEDKAVLYKIDYIGEKKAAS